MANNIIVISVTKYNNLIFEWNETSTAPANNTSTVKWTLTLTAAAYGAIQSSAPKAWQVIINGEVFQGTNSIAIGNNTEKVLASGTETIKHNADGTKSFAYSFYQVFDITFSGNHIGTKTGSGTGVLTAFARRAEITSAGAFNDEENPTFYYSFPNGLYSNLVELQAAISIDGSQMDVPYRTITGYSNAGGSYTFELTDAEREALRDGMPNATKKYIWVYLRTNAGGAWLYSKYSIYFEIINDYPTLSPVVTAFDSTDAEKPVIPITGSKDIIVKGKSNATYAFNATAKKGAKITSYKIVNGDQSVSNYQQGVFYAVQSGTFVFTATDSRGHTITQTVEKPFVDYIPLDCKLDLPIPEVGGQTLTFTIEGKYYNGAIGATQNTLLVRYRYKVGNADFGEWVDITGQLTWSNEKYSFEQTYTGIDYEEAHTVQIEAFDVFTTIQPNAKTVKAVPIFDWGENDFAFNVPVSFQGDTMADFVIEVGTDSMGSNGTWYWRKWKSGRADCYGCRNYGNMGASTPKGALYSSETFTQSLPYGLFAKAPDYVAINIVKNSSGGAAFVLQGMSAPTVTDSGEFCIARPVSGTLSQTYLGFFITGSWK